MDADNSRITTNFRYKSDTEQESSRQDFRYKTDAIQEGLRQDHIYQIDVNAQVLKDDMAYKTDAEEKRIHEDNRYKCDSERRMSEHIYDTDKQFVLDKYKVDSSAETQLEIMKLYLASGNFPKNV